MKDVATCIRNALLHRVFRHKGGAAPFRRAMSRLPLLILLFSLAPSSSQAYFESSCTSARSLAMGGAFAALGDDASSLYINPAGLFLIDSYIIYGEYGEPSSGPSERDGKLELVVPFGRVAAGLGAYRNNHIDGSTAEQIVTGFSARILEGTQDSYFSIGGNIRAGRISYSILCGCADDRVSNTGVTGDLGFILRPLPVISFGYAVNNIFDVDIETDDSSGNWQRIHRWGISLFWEQKVVISYDQEHSAGKVRNSFGFTYKTVVPLELMAGFSEELISGGIRWNHERFNATVSFMSGNDGDLVVRAGFELKFRQQKEDELP